MWAAVFDLDGTLVDSETLSFQAWREVLDSHGYTLVPDDLEAVRGRSYEDTHAHFAIRAALPEHGAFWTPYAARLFELFDAGLTPFDDAVATARALAQRGVPIAIATSSRRERLEATLRAAGLAELFDVTVAGDEVERAKPAPDIFLAAAAKLGVPAERCVAIEDSPVGVEAALAAGMRVVAVARADAHRAFLPADAVAALTAEIVAAAGARPG